VSQFSPSYAWSWSRRAYSIARETLLLELARDSLGEQLTTDDISKREIAMDKELIQLIQAACKADNIPRAIELTKLLHHTASFGMASKVAAFYHLVGLQEKIAFLKEKREQEEEEEDRLEAARRKRRQWTVPDPLPRSLPNLAPSAGGGGPSSRPNLLQDFGPPPAVYRPGLARAVPVVETTRFSANSGDAVEGFSYSADADLLSADATPEGKRKRADEDGMSVDVDEHAKRRAFEVSTPQPKTSACFFTDWLALR
jgi:chromosome transmission fidelity protein 4